MWFVFSRHFSVWGPYIDVSRTKIASLQAQLEQTQAEVQRLASNAARTDSLQSAVDELRAEVAALRSQTRQQSDVEAQLKAVREELVAMRMEMSAEFSRTRMPSVQSTELATTR